MKTTNSLGLVFQGHFTSNCLARLPGLDRRLGPVKGVSLRVSSRLANTLQAGYAVQEYEDLQPGRTILLSLPETSIGDVVAELAASRQCWQDRIILLCESRTTSCVLNPLRQKGAYAGSYSIISLDELRIALLEGDPAAVEEMEDLLKAVGLETLTLTPQGKLAALASVDAAENIIFRFISYATDALAAAGIPSRTAHRMVLAQIQDELAHASRPGGRPLRPPVDLAQVALLSPVLADLARAALQINTGVVTQAEAAVHQNSSSNAQS